MKFTLEDAAFSEDLQIIGQRLRQYNEAFAPAIDESHFAIILQDEKGRLCGGVIGKIGRGWLKIGTMWVDESVRRQGFGRQLMEMAEAEGIRLGCHSAYLNTFSFQAPEFYQKLGYVVFGTLDEFPSEHKRFFMRKSLNLRGSKQQKQS